MALVPLKPTDGGKPVQADPSKQLHLLYVEDDDLNWDVAQLQLGRHYRMKRAKNSVEAVDLLDANVFDVILMDIQLSGSKLSGIDLAQVIRGKLASVQVANPSQSIPIIFLTANDANYSRGEIAASGGTDLVTKPVNFLSLALTISRCLAKKVSTRAAPTPLPPTRNHT